MRWILWAILGAGILQVAEEYLGPARSFIGGARLYDAMSHRLLLGSLFERIAAEVAAVARAGRGCWRWDAAPAACRSCWLAGTVLT